MNSKLRSLTALLGLLAVTTFVFAFLVCAAVTPTFSVADDFISKLGSRGQPYADWWNAIGFGFVGLVFALFGILFGITVEDRLLGLCFFVAGLAFAVAAFPTDHFDANSMLSKVHYASICFALSGWCLGLARLTGSRSQNSFARTTATYTICLSLLPMIAMSTGISSEPVAHRLVLLAVFAWVTANCLRLLKPERSGGIAG